MILLLQAKLQFVSLQVLSGKEFLCSHLSGIRYQISKISNAFGIRPWVQHCFLPLQWQSFFSFHSPTCPIHLCLAGNWAYCSSTSPFQFSFPRREGSGWGFVFFPLQKLLPSSSTAPQRRALFGPMFLYCEPLVEVCRRSCKWFEFHLLTVSLRNNILMLMHTLPSAVC